MEWLEGQYPQAFEIAKVHDDMVCQGAKSVRRVTEHQPYGESRGTQLFESYTAALMAALGHKAS